MGTLYLVVLMSLYDITSSYVMIMNSLSNLRIFFWYQFIFGYVIVLLCLQLLSLMDCPSAKYWGSCFKAINFYHHQKREIVDFSSQSKF